MVELMPDCIFLVVAFALVECHDVVDSLRVLSLFVLADAIFLQDSLPFLWKTLRIVVSSISIIISQAEKVQKIFA